MSKATPNAAVNDRNVRQQLIDERRQQQDEALRKREAERRKKAIIINGIEKTIYGAEGDRAMIKDMLRGMGLGQRIYEIDTIERIGNRGVATGEMFKGSSPNRWRGRKL